MTFGKSHGEFTYSCFWDSKAPMGKSSGSLGDVSRRTLPWANEREIGLDADGREVVVQSVPCQVSSRASREM